MRKQILSKFEILCLLLALMPHVAQGASNPMRPPQNGEKPPKEAFEACKGKSNGADVEVTTPHGKVKATCKSLDGQLVAIPAGERPLPKEAFEDCKGKTEGTVLEVSTPEGKRRATCKSIDGQLAAIIDGDQQSK